MRVGAGHEADMDRILRRRDVIEELALPRSR